MAFFEYGYDFSVDEGIIQRYGCNSSDRNGPVVFETRIHFIVRGIDGVEKRIDWECFLNGSSPFGETEECLLLDIGRRLKDCWMPHPQIRTMIQRFVAFAKRIPCPTGPHGKVPVAVDVEVCTVQREGEEMAAVMERAMKPAHLPPLDLYPTRGIGHPVIPAIYLTGHYNRFKIMVLKAMSTFPVKDVQEASFLMEVCPICWRKPIIGTQILKLLCGHTFHFHCAAHPLLHERNACPTCDHRPAFNEKPPFDKYYEIDTDHVIHRTDVVSDVWRRFPAALPSAAGFFDDVLPRARPSAAGFFDDVLPRARAPALPYVAAPVPCAGPFDDSDSDKGC